MYKRTSAGEHHISTYFLSLDTTDVGIRSVQSIVRVQDPSQGQDSSTLSLKYLAAGLSFVASSTRYSAGIQILVFELGARP